MKSRKLLTGILAGVFTLAMTTAAFAASANDFSVTTAPTLNGTTINSATGFLAKGLGDKTGTVISVEVTYTVSQAYNETVTTTTTETYLDEVADKNQGKGNGDGPKYVEKTRTVTATSTITGTTSVDNTATNVAGKTARVNKQEKTTGYFWTADAIVLDTAVELPEGATADGAPAVSSVVYTVSVMDANGAVYTYVTADGTSANLQAVYSLN